MEREDFVSMRRAFSRKPIAQLLELLSSEDLHTRFFAEMTLRDKSGT